MRRVFRPAGSVLLAAMFLLAAGERAFGFVPCAHHESVPAGDHATGHQGHGDDGPAGHDTHDGPCTCLNACQLGGAAPAPQAATLEPATATDEAVSERLPRDEPRPALTLRLLPYSTAPPAPPATR
jgi:hypothetical protein